MRRHSSHAKCSISAFGLTSPFYSGRACQRQTERAVGGSIYHLSQTWRTRGHSMDHTLHQRLEVTELTEDNLTGALIYGPDDSDIGSVSHLHGSGHKAESSWKWASFSGLEPSQWPYR